MCIDVKADRGETALAFLQLLQASQTLEHHPIASMQLSQGDTASMQLSQGDTASMQLSQGDTASSAFVIGGSDGPLDCTLLHKLPWSAISQVLPSLPLHNVTVLTLTIPELSRNDWANIFVQFVRLEKLMLEEEETAESFVEFIIASTPDDFDDSANANLGPGHDLPFRSLRKLSLCQGYFELGDGDAVQEDFPAFCSALKLRRDYGLPLEKLWLPHDAFHVYVDSLGEVVEELLLCVQGTCSNLSYNAKL
ncbi:hypothetical protein BDN72DRAFT_96091 [Pluteus cervinus]|uniref:Uncharacterized protein n=1 Tax=Pluteus cervinus TaxID=181527 RepID=A0ACD3ANX3_9AGAR|nr:hypothetical protein BDN72DRAFT_96091 [Pluteus cervinus]